MNLAALTDDLYVASQLQAADVAQLADLGVKHLICNRPDNEEAGQLNLADIEAIAAEHGMDVAYVPITMNSLSMDDVEAFGTWYAQDSAPKAAYCRSGTRSSLLWALSQVAAGKISAAAAQAAVSKTGRDVSNAAGLLQQLEAQAKA